MAAFIRSLSVLLGPRIHEIDLLYPEYNGNTHQGTGSSTPERPLIPPPGQILLPASITRPNLPSEKRPSPPPAISLEKIRKAESELSEAQGKILRLEATIRALKTKAPGRIKKSPGYREKYYRSRDEANEKIAYKTFKPGDLVLFLPTRNLATRPWAAFNVGAPFVFLKEESCHNLSTRSWFLARISNIEEKLVDLSRAEETLTLPPSSPPSPHSSLAEKPFSTTPLDDKNPFGLPDGCRWYLVEATEES